MGTRSRLRKKVAPEFTPAPAQNVLQTRPFAPPVKLGSAPTLTDIQAQLDHAQRYGHHLTNFASSEHQSTTPIIQPKLTIGAPGDKYEQEADLVASQVVQQLHSPQIKSPQNQQSVQREAAPEEDELQMKPLADQIQREEMPEEDELQMKPDDLQREEMPEEDELQRSPMLQRKGGGATIADAELESTIQQSRGSGQPLADNLRQPMEHAFGNADFSGVKVHTDAQSDQLNRSIQAKAFTTGQDIFFRQGAYQPGSQGGQELLAHELTHVVQQNGGAVQRALNNTEPLQQKPAPIELSTDPKAQVQRKYVGELEAIGSTYEYVKAAVTKHTAEKYSMTFSEYNSLKKDVVEYRTIEQLVAKLNKTYVAPTEPQMVEPKSPMSQVPRVQPPQPTESTKPTNTGLSLPTLKKVQPPQPTESTKPTNTGIPFPTLKKVQPPQPTESTKPTKTAPSAPFQPKSGSLTVETLPAVNEPVTKKPVFKSPPEFIPISLDGVKYRVKAGQDYLNTELSAQYMQDASAVKGSEVTLMLPTLDRNGEREDDVRVVSDGHHRFVWGGFHGQAIPAKDTGRPLAPQNWQPLKYQGAPPNLPVSKPKTVKSRPKQTDSTSASEAPKENSTNWPSMGRMETPEWAKIQPLLAGYGVTEPEEVQAIKNTLDTTDLEKEPIRGINDLIERALGKKRSEDAAKKIRETSGQAAESIVAGPTLEMGRGDERSPSEINTTGGFYGWDAGIVTLEHARQIVKQVIAMPLSKQRKWVASWKWPTPSPSERNPWVATGIGGSQKGTYRYDFRIPLQAHERVDSAVMIPMTDTGNLDTATIIGVKLLVGPTGDEVLMLTGVPKHFIIKCNGAPLGDEQWKKWNREMGTSYKKSTL